MLTILKCLDHRCAKLFSEEGTEGLLSVSPLRGSGLIDQGTTVAFGEVSGQVSQDK